MGSRLLLDTNIIIDRIIPDRPLHDVARRLFGLARDGGIEVAVFAGSLKDAYYVCSKAIPESKVRDIIRLFIETCAILPFGEAECRESAYSDEPDFEDGLIRAAAELNGIDFIITRDTQAFRHSRIRSMSAETYLELFG